MFQNTPKPYKTCSTGSKINTNNAYNDLVLIITSKNTRIAKRIYKNMGTIDMNPNK